LLDAFIDLNGREDLLSVFGKRLDHMQATCEVAPYGRIIASMNLGTKLQGTNMDVRGAFNMRRERFSHSRLGMCLVFDTESGSRFCCWPFMTMRRVRAHVE
jgi:hypothetical protein